MGRIIWVGVYGQVDPDIAITTSVEPPRAGHARSHGYSIMLSDLRRKYKIELCFDLITLKLWRTILEVL
jgi:hypothetical protein